MKDMKKNQMKVLAVVCALLALVGMGTAIYAAGFSSTIDSTGHVTGYNKKTSNFGTYQLSGATLAKDADNKITATIKLADTQGDHVSTAAFTIDASANDNLNATMEGSTIKLAMEWGTF